MTASSSKPPNAANLYCHQCQATETPLWRAGPAGPKTLCNACGVRYRKHGVLTPRNPARRKSSKAKGSKVSKVVRKKKEVGSKSSASGGKSVVRVGKVFGSGLGGKRYESVFSGLMVVKRDGKFSKGVIGGGSGSGNGGRKRVRTVKGMAYEEERRKDVGGEGDKKEEVEVKRMDCGGFGLLLAAAAKADGSS